MKVLVACEFSGVVRDAFRRKGYDAWSCDLRPGWGDDRFHLQQDVTPLLADPSWDLVIAHPPCTYLANSGAHWLGRQRGRRRLMEEAAEFFRIFLQSTYKRICIENPIPHGEARSLIGEDYSQIISPSDFGCPVKKQTCLWLKGLPHLLPSDKIAVERPDEWRNNWGGKSYRSQMRSVTFAGVAEAMAEQWGSLVEFQRILF